MSYKIGLKYRIHSHSSRTAEFDGKVHTLVHVLKKHEIADVELVCQYYKVNSLDDRLTSFTRPLTYDRWVFITEGTVYDLYPKSYIICPDNPDAFSFELVPDDTQSSNCTKLNDEYIQSLVERDIPCKPTSDWNYCSKCNGILQRNKFCPNCGQRILYK